MITMVQCVETRQREMASARPQLILLLKCAVFPSNVHLSGIDLIVKSGRCILEWISRLGMVPSSIKDKNIYKLQGVY